MRNLIRICCIFNDTVTDNFMGTMKSDLVFRVCVCNNETKNNSFYEICGVSFSGISGTGFPTRSKRKVSWLPKIILGLRPLD